MYKPKVGDWVVRKKEARNVHPFWQSWQAKPIQISYVGDTIGSGYEVGVKGFDGEWLSNYFDPYIPVSVSTNLEDWA